MPYENGLPKYAEGTSSYDSTVEFLKKHEGFKDTTYLDGNGIPTIGYGFTDSSLVKKGNISRAEADRRLKQEVAARESVLSKMKNWDKLSEDSKTALRSYYYNYPAGFKPTTRFMKAWNAGNYEEAIRQVDAGMNDKNNPGLRKRRLEEQALLKADPFLRPVQTIQPTPIVNQSVSTAVRPVIKEEQTVPAYDPTISPYISGKPMVKLRPRVQLPNLIEVMEDSEWEPGFPELKNGKLPGYKDGKTGYVRQNGNDIKFDEDTGELVDQVTGERGTLMLPEINITRANPDNYRSSYDPNAVINGFNALTLGGLNNLDPTQWARRAYDLPKTLFGPMRFSTYMDRWINGNEGLVSSNFQQQHPWYSAGVNLLGGAALVGGSTQGPRIAHNIANRNQFFYKYLTPFSYDHPLKRGLNVAQKILTEPKINLPQDFTPSWMGKINNGIGKGNHGTYIGYIPENIIAKAELNGIENTPEYIDYALKLSRLENKFRDAAFRKYLNLPERDPLYIANQDGTFSYNLPYIEQQYAKNGLKIDTANMNLGVDWITGNGGNLESTKNISFGHGIGSDSSKTFSMQEMTDTWDLHPFRRAEDQLSKKYGDFVRKTADNIYTKLYYKLYDHNKPFKYISGYNLLGGKQLNRIRYSDKVPFQNTIDKISKKLVNFEAGPVMGGKPFVMKTNIPLTRQFTLEGESPVYRIQYGLNADNILPQAYFDWLKYGDKKIASDFELGVPF